MARHSSLALLHNGSERREGPYVRCKCISLTESNAARRLFGCIGIPDDWQHTPTKGYLELANGGTLFLDELHHLPLETQEKLLQALETSTITRVGGKIPIPFNIRIVASYTTNSPSTQQSRGILPALATCLQQLYIETPPLRDHKTDIPLLVQHFLRMYGVLRREKLTMRDGNPRPLLLAGERSRVQAYS